MTHDVRSRVITLGITIIQNYTHKAVNNYQLLMIQINPPSSHTGPSKVRFLAQYIVQATFLAGNMRWMESLEGEYHIDVSLGYSLEVLGGLRVKRLDIYRHLPQRSMHQP